MASSSAELHEDGSSLRPETIDRHRATVSLMEELEAVDWYDQRIDATGDEALAEVLRHNRDEEKEHAMMTLEWLRRRDPELDRVMRQYLFTEAPITEIEEEVEGGGGPGDDLPAAGGASGRGTSLGIGALRDQKETL